MDLEFKSPQHVLEEVRAMRVRGGSPLTGSCDRFLLVARMGNTIGRVSAWSPDEIADA